MYFVTLLKVRNAYDECYPECIGYFLSYDIAVQMLQQQKVGTDWNGVTHAVIEFIPHGQKVCCAQHWFKYDEGLDCFQSIRSAPDMYGYDKLWSF